MADIHSQTERDECREQAIRTVIELLMFITPGGLPGRDPGAVDRREWATKIVDALGAGRVEVTDAMVARAGKTWMLWTAPEPGHEDNARLFMRAVLDAALNGGH